MLANKKQVNFTLTCFFIVWICLYSKTDDSCILL